MNGMECLLITGRDENGKHVLGKFSSIGQMAMLHGNCSTACVHYLPML